MDDLDWIRRGLDKPGKTQTGLARVLGRSPSAITNLLKGLRDLKEREVSVIADYLEVEPPSRTDPAGAQSIIRPSPEVLAGRDLPVFAAAEGGPGEMVVSTDPIDVVPRPWYMREVKDGYAVLVVGDSMSPVFEAGDMAVVNPRLPPLRNKDTIFIAVNEVHGSFTASIKRLLRWNEREWHVKQFNPPRGEKPEFALSRKEWPRALRVVGKYYGG